MSNVAPSKVGIIGAGNISGIYLQNSKILDAITVTAIADIDMQRAAARAAEFDIPRVCNVEELLADPEIEIIINLTIPAAHAEVAMQAIEAGKSVYNEKPLAVSRDDAHKLLKRATEKNVRVGCAPDTFLGGGIQTCRKLIDDGWIGEPVAAVAFMPSHGPESWHPNPDFFYQVGGGPMFDMGPYYLTTLVTLLGAVRRVTGSARASFAERTITNQFNYGAKIPVNTATHIAGIMDFQSGAIGTIITSFDIWAANLPRIEIYGSHGSLSVPDPNIFDGPVQIRRAGISEWSTVPLSHGFTKNSRGLGVADMATAIKNNRPHRASGELAYHVLDLMHAFHDASREDRHIILESSVERPAALPLGLGERGVDP